MRQRISPEELEKRRAAVAEKNAKLEEKRLIELEKKSASFTGVFGKIFWGFCLSVSLFCLVLLVDGALSKKYTTFKIESSFEDKVRVLKNGWMIPATFHWVFLDKQNKFGIHMYKGEFNTIIKSGKIDVGMSPIFNVPSDFKANFKTNELQNSNISLIFLPIALLIFSLIWLFSKPRKSLQWVMFGYFNMVAIPLFLCILIVKVMSFTSGVGFYEIDFSGLVIPD
jgi:hypothetical protein